MIGLTHTWTKLWKKKNRSLPFIHRQMDKVNLFFFDCNSNGISYKVPLNLCVASMYVCHNDRDLVLTSAFLCPFPLWCLILPLLLPQTTLHNPPTPLTLATSCDHTANHQERLTWTLKKLGLQQTWKCAFKSKGVWKKPLNRCKELPLLVM